MIKMPLFEKKNLLADSFKIPLKNRRSNRILKQLRRLTHSVICVLQNRNTSCLSTMYFTRIVEKLFSTFKKLKSTYNNAEVDLYGLDFAL